MKLNQNIFRIQKRNSQIQQKQNESEKLLRNFAFLDLNDLYDHFSVSGSGLTAKQAEQLQEEYGKNIITTGQSNTTLHRLVNAVVNPFNIVLLIIAVITLFTDVIYSQQPDYVTVCIILFLVIISSLVAFIQGERSNSAAEKLSKMISNKADVLRDGAQTEIPIEDVVPGDMVRLSAGDMIPADIRFIFTKDAFVAQGSLTGETNPVEKYADIRSDREDALTDLQNIGFMGTNMVSGSAVGIVLATNNETYFGSMAKSLSGDRAKNSFERGVDSVSSLLIRLMLVMVPVVLLINGFTKGDSKHQVIVKTLGAIQTFGEMDVLCTDKTGTLTEDKIILEKYMNAVGEDDNRTLRHAFLNSYFQTGLKNLLDLAIINRAHENGIEAVLNSYTRLDEIPFDFSRRRMSVLLEDQNGKQQLVTKGAVEEMLAICSYAEWNGQILELDETLLQKVQAVCEQHNGDGLRMIAVAQKNDVAGVELSVDDERDLVLIGFVGFLDPPKESAKAAVTALDNHGVRTVVLTGDSEGVAVKVCSKVGVETSRYLTGKEVEAMDDAALSESVEHCSIFAKLSPSQKERVVKAIQANGHTVGYMGDGINDAPPLHQADVGISVDTAVDIAKETADIILLKKDLMVLEKGVVAGRRTFGNIVKYIKMAASGNFGNMISVIAASIFLPFLPMLPVQILTQNLLCDFSQMGIPFDNVDPEYLQKPRKWETRSIKSFMAFMGPLSSVFDILCFAVMWWIIKANTPELAPLFQCGWFVFGTVSQVLVIHMIRSGKIPFIQSLAAKPLLLSTAVVALSAILVSFSAMASGLDMAPLPLGFLPWLVLLLAGYCLSTQFFKGIYIRRFGEWL